MKRDSIQGVPDVVQIPALTLFVLTPNHITASIPSPTLNISDLLPSRLTQATSLRLAPTI